MWERNYFSHIDPGGRSVTYYLKKYNYTTWSSISENIYGIGYRILTLNPCCEEAVRYDTPKTLARALVRGWMLSGEHRWALMHGDYSVTGVGVYGEPDGGVKATQLFADREKFDRFVDANTTEEFRVPIAEEDPMEDESDLPPYPSRLGPNTPNDE